MFWKTLHRERSFEKPFTGRGVLKNPSQAEGFWKKPSQGEGFWQTHHRQRKFEKPFTGRGVLNNPSQGEEFWKTPHRERGFEKTLTGRGVLKNPSQGEGFWNLTYIHTRLAISCFQRLCISKPLSLWGLLQHNSRCSEPKPLSLWGFLAFLTLPRSLHALMYVCMFQTPLPVRVFVTNIPTYSLSSQHEAQS